MSIFLDWAIISACIDYLLIYVLFFFRVILYRRRQPTRTPVEVTGVNMPSCKPRRRFGIDEFYINGFGHAIVFIYIAIRKADREYLGFVFKIYNTRVGGGFGILINS
jgi:hypothetical protein